MKNSSLSLVMAALLLPGTALAAEPNGSVALYATHSTMDAGSNGDDSGVGFGIRGWAMIDTNWFAHGEFQTTDTDDFDIPLQSLRLGGGYAAAIDKATMWVVKGEFIDFGDFDQDLDQSGFGLHGGVAFQANEKTSLFGSLGYLTTDDTDGLEINVSAHYSFTQRWGGVIDYRTYLGSVDPSGDLHLNDLRLGVTFTF